METIDIILNLINKNYPSEAAFEYKFGLKPKTVYDWKRGKSKSYLKILPKLSKEFNVSTDYLLGNADIKNSPSTIEDEFNKALKELEAITSDFSDEEYQRLIDYASLLKSAKQGQSKP